MADKKQKPVEVFQVTRRQYARHCNDSDGLCLTCGEWTAGGCEPDARDYLCEECGAHDVCGAEWAMVIGRLEVV